LGLFGVKWKNKKVAETVCIRPRVKHIPINLAFAFVIDRLNSQSKVTSMLHGLSVNDPSLKRAMTAAKVKNSFLEFCEQEHVQPTAIMTWAVQTPYQGGPAQDGQYQISTDEFCRFLKTYGIDVTYSSPAADEGPGLSERNNSDQSSQNLDEESASNSLAMSASHKGKVIRIGRHDDLSGPDTDPDDWGAEFEASFTASEAKKKERLIKKILKQPPPGIMPSTAIGRLAVKFAWEIEVYTGEQATHIEVMDRLCKLAATVNETDSLDADVDRLIRADTSVPGKERVKWLTHGRIEKWYGLGTCYGTLKTWRNSYHKKRKGGARSPAVT